MIQIILAMSAIDVCMQTLNCSTLVISFCGSHALFMPFNLGTKCDWSIYRAKQYLSKSTIKFSAHALD